MRSLSTAKTESSFLETYLVQEQISIHKVIEYSLCQFHMHALHAFSVCVQVGPA